MIMRRTCSKNRSAVWLDRRQPSTRTTPMPWAPTRTRPAQATQSVLAAKRPPRISRVSTARRKTRHARNWNRRWNGEFCRRPRPELTIRTRTGTRRPRLVQRPPINSFEWSRQGVQEPRECVLRPFYNKPITSVYSTHRQFLGEEVRGFGGGRAPKARVSRDVAGAEGVECGDGMSPPHLGRGLGRYSAPRFFFDFWSPNSEFRCIVEPIFTVQ